MRRKFVQLDLFGTAAPAELVRASADVESRDSRDTVREAVAPEARRSRGSSRRERTP